jgi:TonB family protein
MFDVHIIPARIFLSSNRVANGAAAALVGALALAPALAAGAQQAAPTATPQAEPASQPATSAPDAAIAPAPSASLTQPEGQSAEPLSAAAQAQPGHAQPPQPTAAEAAADAAQPGSMTEEQLKQMLVGKTLYLRGGYLGDSLAFNEHGGISGHSVQGSYTLSMVEIDRVHLAKHKVELEGVRYGLHFLEKLPYEDPANAYDKVRITPKKKVVKIIIDRELVVKPKKAKVEKPAKGAKDKPEPATANSVAVAANPAPAAVANTAPAADSTEATGPSDEDEAKAEMAAAPEAERPADPNSVTTTLSPAHATKVLKDALDKIFTPGLDDGIMASMPDFWKLYYQAAAAKTDYRPSDPSVLRQSAVDKKARLLTNFEPDSNQFAQDNGIAGMALYHVIVGPDGKPGEISVARPIGFGLDENAVAAIRKAQFEPAVKDGKPVSVLLDLVVQFRIYSKRTDVVAQPEAADTTTEPPKLPGPYRAHQPQ